MYAKPLATAGDEANGVVGAVQSGKQVFGVPEQPDEPAASNANNLPTFPKPYWKVLTYTTPLLTAGG